jgi:Mg-chelatase subunit ChlD/tetratricopeptide (TPR) repeat protein
MLSWLANTEALMLLAAVPVLALLALWAWLSRRWSWRRLGLAPAKVPFTSRLAGRRLLRGLLIMAGLGLACVAAARPQWGREKTGIHNAARDLVVVLDISRSMLAETPSRQLRAQRLLSNLADTLKESSGHRVALVSFAAKAQLAVPLTTDYELFQEAVFQQDAARLPPELRPNTAASPSGTRIGEGLRQAVATHDPKYRGSQIILLVSDGDDPAGDDEWKEGALAARRAGIPVFVAGIGDPTKHSNIRAGSESLPLTFAGETVETKLNEEVLKEIARQTDGIYFPVRTQTVAPGTLYPTLLEAAASQPREATPAEDYHPRFRWFLATGLVFLVTSLFIGDRRVNHAVTRPEGEDEKKRKGDKEKKERDNGQPTGRSQLTRLFAARSLCLIVSLPFCLLVCAAANQPETEAHLRQGNDAYQRKDYAAALKSYEQAEFSASDPGLVAFNKGATLVRLGRLREAELCYLRCLQDGEVPAERRLRALYYLGTTLLQRGSETRDAVILFRAVECFERAANGASGDQELRDDAEHNLELARILWLQVRATAKALDPPELPPNELNDPRNNPFPKGKFGEGGNLIKERVGSDADRGQSSEKDGSTTEKDVPGSGTVDTLADSDELQPLDIHDARHLLAREIRRIERDQAEGPRQVPSENRNVKDW